MTHYRAILFAVSLAAVTILAALYSPPEGGAAPARSVLLSLGRSDVAQAASQPAPMQARARSSMPGAVAPSGIMMNALTSATPLGGAKPTSSANGATATDDPSPVLASEGGKDEGDGVEASGAGDGNEAAGVGDGAGSAGGGSEGAPIDERKLAQILVAYHSQLVQLIEGQKRYPQIARKLGHQGIVQLKFTLSLDGRLVSSQVSSSSGFPELDNGAMQALRAVPKFPAFPTELGPANRPFYVSLSFTLN